MKVNRALPVAAVVGLALSVSTQTADATSNYGYSFDQSHRSMTVTDGAGTFSGQVTFTDNGKYYNPMAWSWKLKGSVTSGGIGKMNCAAGRKVNGVIDKYYTDSHEGLPLDYLWHSTVPKNRFGDYIELGGQCQFVKLPESEVTVQFVFRYSVSSIYDATPQVVFVSKYSETSLLAANGSFGSSVTTATRLQ